MATHETNRTPSMSLRRTLLTALAPAALLLAGGCTESFKANVSRFQALPAPQGQTFYVVAANPQMRGGIEFSSYAAMVAARLTQQGYRPAASPEGVNLLVTLDYGVDNGHEKVVSDIGPAYGPWGYGGFGRRGGWYGGWGGDPFWYRGGFGPDVSSYTFYVSHLSMQIRGRDGRVLFEGRAKARSVSDHLQELVPPLIEAMFTGFPGRSGEDVLITVPPAPKAASGAAPINHGG
jgi:hypothetical protein